MIKIPVFFSLKRAFPILSVILVIPIIAVSYTLGNLSATKNASQSDTQAQYIFREYNGKIGIFSERSPFPIEVLDVYVCTIPEKDSEMLKKGVSARGVDEVRSLIEDFSG